MSDMPQQITITREEQESVNRVLEMIQEILEEEQMICMPCPRREGNFNDFLILSEPIRNEDESFSFQVFARLYLNTNEAFSEYLVPNVMDENGCISYCKEKDTYRNNEEI